MIFLLFLFFIILLFISFLLFDKDYMSPSFIFCAVYIVSIGSALINYTRWGLKDYSFETFSILLGGAGIFILVGWVVKKIVYNKEPNNYSEIASSSRININSITSIILIMTNLLILIITIKEVKAIGSVGGSGSWGEVMQNFRSTTSYSLDPMMNIPGYLQQLQKIPTICAYIYPFIFIYNVVNNTVQPKDYFFTIVAIVIYIILGIVLSNRLNILGIAGAVIIYYFVLHQGNFKTRGVKIIFRLLLIFIGLMLIFYLIRLIVGRLESANTNFIDYVTMYIGGPVKLFDMFIKQPIHDTTIWGKETFVAILGTLRDIGFNIPVYLQHKEFRFYNGIELGNVYSAYRNWFADFGLTGVIVLQGLFALFYNNYYYLLQRNGINNHKLAFIIYGYMSEAIFLHPIDDWLFSNYLSLGIIIYLILFYILYQLITKRIKV